MQVIATIIEAKVVKAILEVESAPPAVRPSRFFFIPNLIRTCHLNLRRPADAKAVYDITAPTPQQQAILASLGLQTLTSEEKQRNAITPRDAPE